MDLTSASLLAELTNLDATFEVRGHRLYYTAPKGVITADAARALQRNKASLILLLRLRRGLLWLSDQQSRWMGGDPNTASDEAFSAALAGWHGLEQEYGSTTDFRAVSMDLASIAQRMLRYRAMDVLTKALLECRMFRFLNRRLNNRNDCMRSVAEVLCLFPRKRCQIQR